ncbi:MAG TPA: hypothetical protein VNA17_04210 [Pyrinomonadaceae bacterium]|nr:hypothetical protein [Pyrinomonadaceae bacterium]
MKILGTLVVLGLCLITVLSPCSGQNISRNEIKGIDAYVKTVDAIRRKRKTAELIFADTSGPTDETEKWRKFPSERALERLRKQSETYSIAYNWLNGGKIVASNFTLFSPSGDWVKYVYHYFRADGTLARVESDYRTFNGDFMVVRSRYFDRMGKQIHQTAKFLDLKTRKPKDASAGVMGDDADATDFYASVEKLPFAHLLKK